MEQTLTVSEIERLIKLCSVRKITSGRYDVTEYVRNSMTKIFRTSVWVKNNGTVVVLTFPVEGQRPNQHKLNINKSRRLNAMSGTFSWGQVASSADVAGTYQLSLSLLLESLGYSAFAKQIALFFYRQFGKDVIQQLPGNWTLSVPDVIGWIKAQLNSKNDIELLREHRLSQSE